MTLVEIAMTAGTGPGVRGRELAEVWSQVESVEACLAVRDMTGNESSFSKFQVRKAMRVICCS
jgi:hypothetical protein